MSILILPFALAAGAPALTPFRLNQSLPLQPALAFKWGLPPGIAFGPVDPAKELVLGLGFARVDGGCDHGDSSTCGFLFPRAGDGNRRKWIGRRDLGPQKVRPC